MPNRIYCWFSLILYCLFGLEINARENLFSSSGFPIEGERHPVFQFFLEDPNDYLSDFHIFDFNKSLRHTKTTKTKRRKPIPCPRVFNPVCADFSGVRSTFINECLVNAENVKYEREWIVSEKGVCPEDYSYYSSRTHKSKRSTHSPHPFGGSDNNWFSDGNGIVHITVPSVFQTQLVKSEIPKTTLNKQRINGINAVSSFPGNEEYMPVKNEEYASDNYYDSMLTNIVQNLQSNHQTNSRILPKQRVHCNLGDKPVCCTYHRRQRTFQNICELNLHNENTDEDWQISYNGPCNRCENNCPEIVDPICASKNGLNYTIQNKCLLHFAMCRDRSQGWKIIKKGVCEDTNSQALEAKFDSTPSGFQFISKFKEVQRCTERVQKLKKLRPIIRSSNKKPKRRGSFSAIRKKYSKSEKSISTDQSKYKLRKKGNDPQPDTSKNSHLTKEKRKS